jgi:hypothetical protein
VARSWQDPEKESFAGHLVRSTLELVRELEAPDLIKAIAVVRADGDSSGGVGVKSLPLKPRLKRPARCDLLLCRAMHAAGIDPNGSALRLAMAYASGELDCL